MTIRIRHLLFGHHSFGVEVVRERAMRRFAENRDDFHVWVVSVNARWNQRIRHKRGRFVEYCHFSADFWLQVEIGLVSLIVVVRSIEKMWLSLGGPSQVWRPAHRVFQCASSAFLHARDNDFWKSTCFSKKRILTSYVWRFCVNNVLKNKL
jgi:hypothetical protein